MAYVQRNLRVGPSIDSHLSLVQMGACMSIASSTHCQAAGALFVMACHYLSLV